MPRELKQKTSKAAKPFRATRVSHQNEAAEDYTELISDLISINGEARIGTIADRLGISHVTALRTVRRLQEEGYVKTAPHKPIILTPKGSEIARQAKERHRVVLELLIAIGVPNEQAEIDAEGAEHHISAKTLEVMKKFLLKNKVEI